MYPNVIKVAQWTQEGFLQRLELERLTILIKKALNLSIQGFKI